MSQIHPARLRQQRQSVNPTQSRLAGWDAVDLIRQAVREGRPASELLDELIAEDKAAKSAARANSVWEMAGNFALIGLGLAFLYCAVIGATHILAGMGVGA